MTASSAMNMRIIFLLCLVAVTTAAPAAPSDVDLAFDPGSPTSSGTVLSVVVQPNGLLVVGGSFTQIGNGARNRIARMFPNGTLDPAFNPNANGELWCLAQQADLKLLVGGTHTYIGGLEIGNISRVAFNGTAESLFNPQVTSYVQSISPQPDGRIVIGGWFQSVGGVTRRYLARINTNGTLDTSFAPVLDDDVNCTALQQDGKVLIGGLFTRVGTVSRNRLARLNADGTLDTGFLPAVNGAVKCVVPQPDGKILIGGWFTTASGQPRDRIARLLPTGAADPDFIALPGGRVTCMLLQTDGKILVCAEESPVRRFLPSGADDTEFTPVMPGNGLVDGYVSGMALQPDGKVVVGGLFKTIGGVSRNRIARLENSPATQSFAPVSPTRLQWMRSGASPEIEHVTFDLSINGGAVWTALGSPSRIAGGWELGSLILPATGHIRARGRTQCGNSNGSSALVETMVPFALAAMDLWRYNNFGTLANTANAAANADPDKDGLENLVEFAFGLNPNTPDATALPQWVLEDNDYGLTFTRPAGVDGITYIGEYSTSMAPGSWTPAVNVSTPPEYRFLAPAITERLYLRVRVTVP